VAFDASHVVPHCLSNTVQVLPAGIVCKPCNQYFGSKVERWLLDDPFMHIVAVTLGLVDPDDMQAFRARLFDERHPPLAPPSYDLAVHTDIKSRDRELRFDVSYSIKGSMVRTYDLTGASFLSRAIHKIAFESLAWGLFVQGHEEPVDLFSAALDPVRRWAREGHPTNRVRPVLRILPQQISADWEAKVWRFDRLFAVELRLFGDWYVVSLTSQPADVLKDILADATENLERAWVIGETVEKLRP
jgi:hypothetical protein